MRSLFFIFSFVALCFIDGFSVENKTAVIRMDLNPRKIVLCEERALLMTRTFGPVVLDNLQCDKEGYYTTCQIFYRCEHCHKNFDTRQSICNCCGSHIFHITVKESHFGGEYLTSQTLLQACLDDPSLLQCGEVTVSGGCDDQGNASATANYNETSDDNNKSFDVKCEVSRDSDGNVTSKAEASVSFKF